MTSAGQSALGHEVPDPSPLESARFKLTIGRWNPARPSARLDPTGFDVVIVRRPADWCDHWFELTTCVGYTAIHADTLMYWEWRDRGEPLELSRSMAELVAIPTAQLESMVRSTFDGYRNHYRSNPLLDPAAALDGYVEWARSVADDVPGSALALSVAGREVAFGAVDWSVDPPDIRLAGVVPDSQRQGLYPDLLLALMSRVRARGSSALRISTQAHNVPPQRAWAALGWKPFDALDTAHLVRMELLAGAR